MPYHVNPETGVASLCKAKQGRCPFGEKAHYKTWEEAQEQSDIVLAKAYQTLPTERERELIIENIKSSQSEFAKFNNLTRKDRIEFLSLTDNEELLRAVIHGEIMYSEDLDICEAALNNKHCPPGIITAVAIAPNKFSVDFQILAARSPAARENDLFVLAQDTSNTDVEKSAMLNPVIPVEEIIKYLTPVTQGKDVGHPVCYLAWNDNCPPDLAKATKKFYGVD